ncbi:uncharacterized protein K441DRAFT_692351 [Cenococcum geophilum 1.58]|uniref:uncharacterized protein n=1 Tax=Cenococcum geophilum 1.58 TaxID=794803 RepID=UPI00358E62AD|nr:hypothetical protein K441DRAFT_692351 [Cenococcum geophilum 1.58]
MPPTLEMNLTVIEQNLDSMHQEAKHVLSKLIESCRRESELRQENEALRQQSTGLQALLDQAEKDKDAIQEQLTSLGDLGTKNDNLSRELEEAHRLIRQLEEEIHEDESKIESIESMLSSRRKRPRSSGQIRNCNNSDVENYNPSKRHRQDSSFDEKLHGSSYNSSSAPVRRRDSAQVSSDTLTRNPINPPSHHAYDSPPANELVESRDRSSSRTANSVSTPQNNCPTALNGGGNGHRRSDSDTHYPATSKTSKFPPDATSEVGLGIRGRAIDSRATGESRAQAGTLERGKIICHGCWEQRQNCYT